MSLCVLQFFKKFLTVFHLKNENGGCLWLEKYCYPPFKGPFWLISKQTHGYLTEGSSTLPPSTTITHPPSVIRLGVRPSGEQHWTLREAARQLNKQQFIGRGMNTLPSLEAISRAFYWCWEILMKRGEGLITPAWDDVFPCTKTYFTWPNKGRVHLN